MKQLFQGYYFKHQKGERTLCLIAGRSDGEQFIQVVTENSSWKLPYTEGNYFSKKGVVLDIHAPGLVLTGKIRYGELSPIRHDIMGPFRFFPMECSHGIVSMGHRLEGSVILNGETIDFTGGKGYIERDGGKSFPSSYTWIQANDFEEDCSVVAAIAAIPVFGLKFWGCICAIQYGGREYRLATYLGVRIICCTEKRIILEQGRYRLDIRIHQKNGQPLSAPQNGTMTRTVAESASCPADFLFYERGKPVFHFYSRHASFEFETEIRQKKARKSKLRHSHTNILRLKTYC